MFRRAVGIVLALDIDSLDEARSLVSISAGEETVVGYKIGFSLALRWGLSETVKALQDLTQLPLIYDHQKAGTDIPQMGEPFARCCAEAGIRGVIVFPQAGPETLTAFVRSISSHGMVPIVGGMMTHPGYLRSDGGFIGEEAPLRMYCEALRLGVSHVVVPGNRPDDVRRYLGQLQPPLEGGLSVLMPGIGSQGGQVSEALRAVGQHRGYPVIGSAVYRAPDPRRALEGFAQLVKSHSPQTV